MKILLVHNHYQHAGGEDIVFEMEYDLLKSHGHDVDKLVFDNDCIHDRLSKIKTGIRILYNTQSARSLEDRIINYKPDIIHIHNFFPVASPSLLYVAKKFNISVVVTLHNFRLICPSAVFLYRNKIYEQSLTSWFPIDAIIKGVYRNSILDTAAVALMSSVHSVIGTWKNKVDKFIVLTEFAKRKFKISKVNIHDSQFVIKPNFSFDHGASEELRENFFLYAGRLSAEKGIDLALTSAARFGFMLVIAGDGPLRDKVKDYASAHSNIQWIGFQAKAQVIELMKRSKALIVPSVCYEGFPLSVVEAMSTGTPIIASRLGSLAEIISDNVNGMLFTPGDSDDLHLKIEQLLSQKNMYKQFCYNARATYLQHYTPEKNYQQLLSIYHNVLESKVVKHRSRFNYANYE